MSRKLYVEAEPFVLRHVDEAKKAVFDYGKAICMSGSVGATKGMIQVKPTEGGGAEFKISCIPAGTAIAEVLRMECPDADSFEDTFRRARDSLLRKMNEAEAQRRKYLPKA